MSLWEILLISFGVSVDALAVSVGAALAERGNRFRNGAMAALYFGGSQTLMPLAGFAAASLCRDLVAAVDHYIAFALLAIVGGKMIVEACRAPARESSAAPDAQTPAPRRSFFTWGGLVLPAVATSLDALAVGAGIAFAGAPILLPALSMGVVTGAVSFAGVQLGQRIGRLAGERAMQIAGGAAIILIGLKILLADLCG